MQTRVVQAIIIIGLGKLARNVSSLATAAENSTASAATTLTGCRAVAPCIGIECRCIVTRNGRMRKLVGIIQAANGSDSGSELWLRCIGVKNAPIRSPIVIDCHTKDLLCQ